MPRYFIEVSYKGTAYSGFQVQKNSNTIQAEVEKALKILFKQNFSLTGSSRTDAGVHALQNYFHFDTTQLLTVNKNDKIQKTLKLFSGEISNGIEAVYNLNAILPRDIVIKKIFQVADDAHCRFDATCRSYRYSLYGKKDPMLYRRSYFYPYPLDVELLNKAAKGLLQTHDFESFSKRNSQVKNYRCTLYRSEWKWEGEELVYLVEGNRFLRGMVRGLVGTMLRVGRGKLDLDGFKRVIESRAVSMADFSVPGHGLMLMEVKYPDGYFEMAE